MSVANAKEEEEVVQEEELVVAEVVDDGKFACDIYFMYFCHFFNKIILPRIIVFLYLMTPHSTYLILIIHSYYLVCHLAQPLLNILNFLID